MGSIVGRKKIDLLGLHPKYISHHMLASAMKTLLRFLYAAKRHAQRLPFRHVSRKNPHTLTSSWNVPNNERIGAHQPGNSIVELKVKTLSSEILPVPQHLPILLTCLEAMLDSTDQETCYNPYPFQNRQHCPLL